MERGVRRLGRLTRPLLALIALLSFLAGVGLVLPAATGILAWLTPWSAAVMAVMMLLAVAFHVSCRESPRIAVGLVLFALAGFVGYGRAVLAPF
jgi:hypothetical protein